MSRYSEDFYIGVDVGTQGTKAVMIKGDTGEIIGDSRKSYGIVEKPDGTREQNAEDWKDAVVETVGTLVKNLDKRDRERIKGIGISGQQHGFVPLDKEGKVIRNVKLWNDTSTARQCEEILDKLGGLSKALEYTGNNILPGYTAPKVLWLKENEPENYDKLNIILLPHDYINFFLTGEKKAEPGDASGTAYYNVKERQWSEEVLRAIDSEKDLKENLPELIENHEPVGFIRKDVLDLLGLESSSKIIVSSGGGDNMMGAIGTGNTKRGIITASLGTSGTIYAYSDFPVIDKLGELAAFCDSTGGWLPLACTMNVTVATEMIKSLFQIDNVKLEKLVKSSLPGAHGLILLPYFNGERTPNVPYGTGVFFGINEFTLTEENLARSTMEGVTLGLRYGLEIMKREGIKQSEIRLTGGGSKSSIWRQIVADIFNATSVNMKIDEAASFGAALQAMWCYFHYNGENVEISDITDEMVKVKEETRCEPIKENVEVYDELYSIQTELGKALNDVFQNHRELLVKRFQ